MKDPYTTPGDMTKTEPAHNEEIARPPAEYEKALDSLETELETIARLTGTLDKRLMPFSANTPPAPEVEYDPGDDITPLANRIHRLQDIASFIARELQTTLDKLDS